LAGTLAVLKVVWVVLETWPEIPRAAAVVVL